MPLLKADGADVFYELSGDMSWPVVTLINGHSRSSTDFRMMVRVLNENHLRVLTLDNRGSGQTVTSRAFDLSDFLSDVVAIWDQEEIPVTVVLGISMGGFIAQGLALNTRDRVNSLILVSTAPDEGFINHDLGPWVQDPVKLNEKLKGYFSKGFYDRNPLFIKSMAAQILSAMTLGHFSERSNAQRKAMAGTDWNNRLKEITQKTLIIHGEEDQIIRAAAARTLHREIPLSQLKLLPNVGHLVLAEAPKLFYELVLIFIRDIEK